MTTNFVQRKTAWESNTSLEFLGLLITENFKKLFINKGIDSPTDGRDVSSVYTESNGLLNSGYKQGLD